MNTPMSNEWEEEFDSAFDWIEKEKERAKIMYGFTSEKLKQFIRETLLSQREQIIKELEGLKHKYRTSSSCRNAFDEAVEKIKSSV